MPIHASVQFVKKKLFLAMLEYILAMDLLQNCYN